MRNAFARAVSELSDLNSNLVMLAGDIGNRLFDDIKEKHPNRFYNCGIAEANMTGVAAGLATCGYQPITYSITPFNTLRCLEQIRVDICYPNLPVIIVGTGSGLSYASLGATHHSLEDIGIMRALPNMHIVCPADEIEVKLALVDALQLKRPTYLRLGIKGEPRIHHENPVFKIGKGIVLENGEDIVILSVGNMASLALNISNRLKNYSVTATVVSMHTVKPLDHELLTKAFDTYKAVVLLEEHGAGGAGSAVLEWGNIAGVNLSKLMRLITPDIFLSGCGTQVEARKLVGLECENVANKIIEKLEQ